MKVVIPVNSLGVGGGAKSLATIANALAEHGHDAEVVIPRERPVHYRLDPRVTVTRVPKLCRETVPYGDIVLVNYYTTFKPSFKAWPGQCVRICQGFEAFWVPDKEYAVSTYRKEIPVIAISTWLKDQLKHHAGVSAKIVHLGIDPAVFRPGSGRKGPGRKTVRIMYIARDPDAGYRIKAFPDFAEAMSIFHRMYSGKYRVILVCPEKPLELPGIPHKTVRPDSDRAMAKLYRQADLFVSSSVCEGFALPILEAMACKTPVVTTRSGGIRDFCRHLETAWICPPRQPAALARGMLRLLSDRPLYRKLRSAGYRASRPFTVDRFKREMVRTLESIHFSRKG